MVVCFSNKFCNNVLGTSPIPITPIHGELAHDDISVCRVAINILQNGVFLLGFWGQTITRMVYPTSELTAVEDKKFGMS